MAVVLLSVSAFPVGYAAAWQLYHRLCGVRIEMKSTVPFLFYLNFFVSDFLQTFNPPALLFVSAQLAAMLLQRAAPPETPPVQMRFPFRGRWLVASGGPTRSTSHSWTLAAQRYAYDFVVGTSFADTARQGNGQLEDYPAFGQPIFSPVDGKVVSVQNAFRDSRLPGSGWLDWWVKDPRGNHVLIECQADHFVLVAHLRCNTVEVQRGQFIKAGTRLGQCGNSGRSTEPHLHLHCQRGARLAFGVGLPLIFLSKRNNAAENIHADGQQLERGMQIEWAET